MLRKMHGVGGWEVGDSGTRGLDFFSFVFHLQSFKTKSISRAPSLTHHIYSFIHSSIHSPLAGGVLCISGSIYHMTSISSRTEPPQVCRATTGAELSDKQDSRPRIAVQRYGLSYLPTALSSQPFHALSRPSSPPSPPSFL